VSTYENKTTTTTRYSTHFAPADESIPYRIVGTYEYSQAVEKLNQLVHKSTSEQIEVYDRMLQIRPEFSFVSGVDLSALNGFKPGQNAQIEWLDPFKRRGLAWMTALAKVELGTTMSMYGRAKFPFTVFAPTAFDVQPFMAIIYDDLASHLNALTNEPGFRTVVDPIHVPDSNTLAYLRRIKLMRDMIRVLYEANDPSISLSIAPMEQKLSRMQQELIAKVALSEMALVQSKSLTSMSSRAQRLKGGRCEELVGAIQESTPSSNSSNPYADQPR
jgi:hypothetical protein